MAFLHELTLLLYLAIGVVLLQLIIQSIVLLASVGSKERIENKKEEPKDSSYEKGSPELMYWFNKKNKNN